MDRKIVNVRLRLPSELVVQLDAYAKRRNVSRNALIRMLLSACVEGWR